MLKRTTTIAATLVLIYAGSALGAVSADEAAQLGKNLTMIGAEKAGNKDGTIPEFSGGNTKSPPGYKHDGWRPDPYAGEKPQFSITAKNMAQYADKLSEGAKAMLKKYPSFRMDIYKTYRSTAHPKYVQDNTKKCATTAKLTDNGLAFTGAHACYPFPIPKNGSEAIWNHNLHYEDVTYRERYRSYTVDANGRATMQTEGNVKQEFPYWDQANPNSKDFYRLKVNYVGPARRAGEAFLIIDPTDYARDARKGWQYLPGQRRTKLAPELSFDTPCSIYGGQTTWDDLFLFSGSPERYNWKLVGKKEMYIPYNDYKMLYQVDHEKDLLKAKHPNPDLVRWELHRVWVVEATLKSSKRHLYHRRVFYLDEDSWRAAAADQYDGRGQLYRIGFNFVAPSYDSPCMFGDAFYVHDLLTDSYAINALPVRGKTGIIHGSKAYPPKEWTPDVLAGEGIR